uniref:LRRCT domain-containing protein n=1 Tax=Angiostrongylus cantonensis TaxID=6313 RepID=A0A0K0DJ95_ANGCA
MNDEVLILQEPCKCFNRGFDATVNGIMIGCYGKTLPQVSKALHLVNESFPEKVHIWNSHLTVIPSDMFDQVKPRYLSIERSFLALLRENALGAIGPRLHGLSLRNNNLKIVDRSVLQGLTSLLDLDLSGNRISSLKKGVFDLTPELRELSLNDNDIATIEDRTFSKLTSLERLSLSGNHIRVITKDMFYGLNSLEVLNLQNNQITSIDWSAFANLKQLRILDLGTNHVTNVELRGLENLQKLFLNNNSLNSLNSVSLRDLPSLILLSLDRNSISEIGDGDLSGLARSTRLESLTIAANNISQISQRAFSSVQHLSVLAIQNNQLTTLTKDGQPYLRTLRRLSTLLVSGNQLRSIGEEDLPRSLTVLAADHNLLENIDENAFKGMNLHKLFINNNKLPFLHPHTFDSISFETLEAIDVTSNAWQCVCGKEWLGDWLEKAGDSDVGDGVLGCLVTAARRCAVDPQVGISETRSVWVTVTASTLAVVSLLILVAIAFLYITDGKQRVVLTRPLIRRTDSDLHKLIPDLDTLIPHDIAPKRAHGMGDKKRVHFEEN